MPRLTLAVILIGTLLGQSAWAAEQFKFPTANHALVDGGGEDKFLVGTPGKPPGTGGFGCVRSDGWQMHEGLDIRALTRDKRDEPTDPVLATANGTVAYSSDKPGLSNYGRYVILRHQVEGLEIYSLYAHLSEIDPSIKPGKPVRAGDPVGVMGRSTNTRTPITKDRAHVHFELNLMLSDRFAQWHQKNAPEQRNDHGAFNGHNLVGIDPKSVFLQQKLLGDKFSLLAVIQKEPELCRVLVRATAFSYVKKYAPLVVRNPVAEKEGVAGYEISLDFNGVPIRLTPRAASEIKGGAKVQLLGVNEAEYKRNPCRKLVRQRNGKWELGHAGEQLIDLLLF